MQDNVFVCGGSTDDLLSRIDICFTADKTMGGKWRPVKSRMKMGRSYYTLTTVGQRLVATGGYVGGSSYEGSTDAVEIYSPGRGWENASWTLEFADHSHCAVAVDASHLLVVSGQKKWKGGMQTTKYNIDTGVRSSIDPPPGGAEGGDHVCTRHQDHVYIAGYAQYSGNYVKVFKYFLSENTWDTSIPNLNAVKNEQKAVSIAVIAGELTVFGGRGSVYVLRDNAWVAAHHQPQVDIKYGAVVVLP